MQGFFPDRGRAVAVSSRNLAPDVAAGNVSWERVALRAHAAMTQLLSLVMIGLGLALLVRTLAAGGGQVGILVGLLFIGLGAGRFYLSRKAAR